MCDSLIISCNLSQRHHVLSAAVQIEHLLFMAVPQSTILKWYIAQR